MFALCMTIFQFWSQFLKFSVWNTIGENYTDCFLCSGMVLAFCHLQNEKIFPGSDLCCFKIHENGSPCPFSGLFLKI